jgi:hypothetical protein
MCATKSPFAQVAFGFALLVLACQPSTGDGGGPVNATGGDNGGAGAGGGGGGGGGATGSGGTSQTGGSTGTGGSSATGGSGGAQGTGGASGSSGCAGTLVKCGTTCVDTTGSQSNCGMCGHACRADQECWQSGCRCPTGQGDCGGVCKDIMSSNVNCGMCNNPCATGATCMTGVCNCPAGQTVCSNACTDMNSDRNNCGKCGMVCSTSTSCLFGACLDPTSLACSPAAKANTTTATTPPIKIGKYWINNNQWGAGTGSGTQSIWSTCQQGDLVGWGTMWNWTGQSNAVKSYASIVLGWHWGLMVPNVTTGMPVQISAGMAGKKINCGWAFTDSQTGGSADVAYDIFAHTTATPTSSDDPTDEIMIWLYRANGAGPVGTRQVTGVSIDSAMWDLYRGMTTDNSGKTLWNVFSYVRQSNATSAVVNVMDFMSDLAARTWISPQKYVTSVEAGTEIFTGNGELDTTGYYCRVQ